MRAQVYQYLWWQNDKIISPDKANFRQNSLRLHFCSNKAPQDKYNIQLVSNTLLYALKT